MDPRVPGAVAPEAPLSHRPPSPAEAAGLLAAAALLFWGGALLLRDQPVVFLSSVLPLAAFLGPAVAWAEWRGVERLAFPASPVAWRRIVAACALLAGVSALALCSAALLSQLQGATREEDALRAMLEGVHPGLRLVLFALLPALCEEFLFRGAVLACLRRWGGLRACVASGLLFGAFHGSPVRFLPVALLGVALAAVVWRTGNIWLAVAGHAVHNSVVLWAVAATGGAGGTVPPGLLVLMAGAGVVLGISGCRGLAGRAEGTPPPAAPEGGAAPTAESTVRDGGSGEDR